MASSDHLTIDVEFGRFKILVRQRELLADGHLVELGGRTFDLLMALIEARGAVVSKNDLMSLVWPGRIVEENNLHGGISALRKALGAERDLIRTVAGRGYQFVGTIRQHNPAPTSEQLTNLPAPSSELISREVALSEVKALLSEHRFVTLCGAGGIGKTRLAVEAARDLVPMFPDGVWIADLAPISDPELVPASVAVALGLSSSEVVPDRIASSIGSKHLLLVLDNCEHVINIAARTAESLVRAGSKIFVLCTSREPLRAEGECLFQVQPLDVPKEDATRLEDVLSAGAAQLFVRRARAAQPQFRPDSSAAAELGAICRRLDGMPLAIEFAAARAAVLGLGEVALRLDNRFRLLTGGRRTALPRQQTLRATLDWSYELLAEPERQALCRLGVFAGAFTLEAASAILSPADHLSSETAEQVSSLVEKSLLVIQNSGAVAQYRMPETTRAYALERLAERGELQRTLQLHAEYYVRVLKRATTEWKTGSLAEWCSTYCHLIDDARVTLDWAFSADGNRAMAVKLTIAVVPIWIQLWLFGEAIDRVEQGLDAVRSDAGSDPRLEMELNAALGAALWLGGLMHRRDFPYAKAACTTALALAERLDDTDYQLTALRSLHGLVVQTEARVALTLAEKFNRVAQIEDDPSALKLGELLMSYTHLVRGELDQARRQFDSAVRREVTRPHHLPFIAYEVRMPLVVGAWIMWFQGFPEQAARIAREGIEMAGTHAVTLCQILSLTACPLAMLRGDLTEARRCVQLLLDLPKRGGPYEIWVQSLQGALLIMSGDVGIGIQALHPGYTECRKLVPSPWDAVFSVILADALSATGNAAASLTVIDEALSESEATGAHWYVAEQLRVKGEVILRTDGRSAVAQAEGCYMQSLRCARQQGSLSWELRAATSLARLRQRQGRTAEALDVIQPVFDRFTEGFETADLSAASALIDTLRTLPR